MKINKVFPVLFSFTILFLIIFNTNIDLVIQTFLESNIQLIILCVFLSITTNFFLGSVRLYSILHFFGFEISYSDVFFIKVSSYPLKISMPSKIGEFVKPIYLKKRYGVSLKRGTGIILLDMILISTALSFFIFFGLFLIGSEINLSLIFLFLPLLIIIGLKSKKFKGIHFPQKLEKIKENLTSSLKNITYFEIFVLIIFSLVESLLIVINYYLMFISLGVSVPFFLVLGYIPLIMILTKIPFAIGGIGFREASVVLLFSSYSPVNVLFAVGILFSTIDYLIPALIGLPFTKKFITGCGFVE